MIGAHSFFLPRTKQICGANFLPLPFLSSITHTTYLPQPPGKTAIISGLNYTSRIFALLGEILVRIRVDKRSPPIGHFATARLEEIQSLHSRIMAALIHAPEPLRLKETQSQFNIPHEDGGAGFRQATFAVVKDMFDNPYASRENALNPYLVMQANLYVTQVSFDVCLLMLPACKDFANVSRYSNSFVSSSNNIVTSWSPHYTGLLTSNTWPRIERPSRANS
jgi:hypothetical protein